MLSPNQVGPDTAGPSSSLAPSSGVPQRFARSIPTLAFLFISNNLHKRKGKSVPESVPSAS